MLDEIRKEIELGLEGEVVDEERLDECKSPAADELSDGFNITQFGLEVALIKGCL